MGLGAMLYFWYEILDHLGGVDVLVEAAKVTPEKKDIPWFVNYIESQIRLGDYNHRGAESAAKEAAKAYEQSLLSK